MACWLFATTLERVDTMEVSGLNMQCSLFTLPVNLILREKDIFQKRK